jgi:hypothetical protein
MSCHLHLQGEENGDRKGRISITLMMEAAWPYEMLASYHIIAYCHNAKDHDLNLQHHENLEV